MDVSLLVRLHQHVKNRRYDFGSIEVRFAFEDIQDRRYLEIEDFQDRQHRSKCDTYFYKRPAAVEGDPWRTWF